MRILGLTVSAPPAGQERLSESESLCQLFKGPEANCTPVTYKASYVDAKSLGLSMPALDNSRIAFASARVSKASPPSLEGEKITCNRQAMACM